MSERRRVEKKPFSYDEAAAALPEVARITEEAHRAVEELRSAVEDGPREAERFEAEATAIVNAWVERLLPLGVEVKGIWLVDFDNGAGYYCWRWPEPSLQFFHSHDEGFAGRMRIQ